jgi:hypothetical protein
VRLPLAAIIAAAVAVGINLGVRAAGIRWMDVPADPSILSLRSVIIATLAGVLVATVCLYFLAHTQARPFSAFRVVVGVVFLASCLPPVVARFGWLPRVPAVDTATMLVLIGMNAATCVVVLATLTTFPRGRY